MTYDEVVAVLRFAGTPDAERLAAAFVSHSGVPFSPRGGEDVTGDVTPAGVPSCPECAAPGAEVAWLGGLPDGSGHWRCTRCGHTWTTPGRAADTNHGSDLAGQIAEARRLLARPDDEQLGCWSAPPRCAALEDMLQAVCDLAEAAGGDRRG